MEIRNAARMVVLDEDKRALQARDLEFLKRARALLGEER